MTDIVDNVTVGMAILNMKGRYNGRLNRSGSQGSWSSASLLSSDSPSYLSPNSSDDCCESPLVFTYEPPYTVTGHLTDNGLVGQAHEQQQQQQSQLAIGRPILGRRFLTKSYDDIDPKSTFSRNTHHSGSSCDDSFNFTSGRISATSNMPLQQKYYCTMPETPRCCALCVKNGELLEYAMSHALKEKGSGRILCPTLRNYVCPTCNATGDNAHTESYCPKRHIGRSITMALKNTPRNSTGLRRRKFISQWSSSRSVHH